MVVDHYVDVGLDLSDVLFWVAHYVTTLLRLGAAWTVV